MFQHNKCYIQQTYKVTFYKMGETQGISPIKKQKKYVYIFATKSLFLEILVKAIKQKKKLQGKGTNRK